METITVKAIEAMPFDTIEVVRNDRRTIEDVRENSAMDGVWLEFTDRSAMFYKYEDTVQLVSR